MTVGQIIEEDHMLIPNILRECVVFLLYIHKVTHKETFAGTAFLAGAQEGSIRFVYLVTAKHVIIGITEKSIDNKVYIRTNKWQGASYQVETDADQWSSHPTDSSVDVSVFQLTSPEHNFDNLIINTNYFATNEIIQKESIGLGLEVFITGLFSNHAGKNRNLPIVRIGNIASMPEEKIDTATFGSMDAYLIEARSIGGLSGSPVFVSTHSSMPSAFGVGFQQAVTYPGMGSNPNNYYLLGLIHGHWDVNENAVDELVQDIRGNQVNVGIAIVVPASKILEIINQPKWVEERRATSNPAAEDE
jgi:hypothetical protein